MKWRKTKVVLPEPTQDKAAGWIAKGIIKLRQKWVASMNRLMAKLSPFWLKTVWACGTLIMVAYCSCLIAFSFGKGNSAMFRTGVIHRPLMEIKNVGNSAVFTKSASAILPIIRFHKYLDSLATTPKGRLQRDSLVRSRPGLMDSLAMVERLYCQ